MYQRREQYGSSSPEGVLSPVPTQTIQRRAARANSGDCDDAAGRAAALELHKAARHGDAPPAGVERRSVPRLAPLSGLRWQLCLHLGGLLAVCGACLVVGYVAAQANPPDAPGFDRQKPLALGLLLAVCGGWFVWTIARTWTRAIDDREQLRAQQDLVLHTSADGVVGWRYGKGIVFANRAAYRLLGYTPADLLGSPPERLWCPALGAGRLPEPGTELPSPPRSTPHAEGSALERFVRRDGTTVPVEVARSMMVLYGQPMGEVISFRDVTARLELERELAQMHAQTIELAREAGMAEVATGVLHNVGNVLNSAAVSAQTLGEQLRRSHADRVQAVATLLGEHQDDLPRFLRHNARGRVLPRYLSNLAQRLDREHHQMAEELSLLDRQLEHIRDIVATQQIYGQARGVDQPLELSELLDQAVELHASALSELGVEVLREYGEVPRLTSDRRRILQVFSNLISNAQHALAQVVPSARRLTLRTGSGAMARSSTECGAAAHGATVSGATAHSSAESGAAEIGSTAHGTRSSATTWHSAAPARRASQERAQDQPRQHEQSAQADRADGPPAGEYAWAEVEDSGVGIAAELGARIFAYGFTTREDGHGFGLHISALSAAELGGRLTAHSAGPGQGARFRLELPLKRKECAG